MSELRKARKKLLAVRRAEQRLRQRLETIDWEEEYLLPELDALEKSVARGELPEFTVEEEDD